jgi:hypothetical protein
VIRNYIYHPGVQGHKIPPEERDQLRQDSLDYCERDTWATVMLLKRLR